MIRPFLPNMTRSELFTVMVGGFATGAGGVLAAYIGMGRRRPSRRRIGDVCSGCTRYRKIMYPETEVSETAGDVALPEIDSGDKYRRRGSRRNGRS